MLLSELSLKDVVNDQDGSKIGKVTDLEIDALTGKILSVKIQGGSKLYNFFNKNTISIPWNRIMKIGSDVIIIDEMSMVDISLMHALLKAIMQVFQQELCAELRVQREDDRTSGSVR